MSDNVGECVGPGEDGVKNCGEPVHRSGLCDAHTKQRQRHPDRPLTPIDNLTPWQRVEEARISLEDALKSDEIEGLDGDEYEKRCEKANRVFRRAVEAFAKRNLSTQDRDRLAKLERDAEVYRKHREATRAGLAKARARGKRPGPRGADPRKVAAVVKQFRRPIAPPLHVAVKKAAKKLRVAERTVWRALRRAADKSPERVSNPTDASPDSPQPG